MDSYIKFFIESQLPAKRYQIHFHMSVTVRLMKCLPPNIGDKFYTELRSARPSDLTIARNANVE